MNGMTNFKDSILEVAGKEKIEAIVITNYDYGEKDKPAPPVISWEEAIPILDYEYHAGFGGVDCHAICAWTKTRILFVSQYDGATHVEWMYRNPTSFIPDIPGG
jgi:hypothetical protein